jgi:NAD(P)-dependent dehydrogenase (short-subunit alcohol dehydrogenase family)
MSTAVIIVGSSRGFGRSVLENVMKNESLAGKNNKLLIILLTTSAAKTKCVFNEVHLKIRGHEYKSQEDSNIQVIVEEVDLCDVSDCVRVCSVLTISLQHHRWPVHSVFAFMNSGSIEPVGPLLHKPHEKQPGIDRFMKATAVHINLNFLSFASITKTITQYCITHKVDRARIVNISSLAAIQELYGMSIYSAIKGARDSFIRSLALELERDGLNPNIKFLSYAPGPMLTDIVKQSLIGPNSPENHVKQGLPTFVDPDISAARCVALLVDDNPTWKSGSHLDFYDVTTQ